MKTHTLLLTALFCFFLANVSAQEKNTKSQKIIQNDPGRIEVLLNSKNFEFIANTAFPTSGGPKNLVGSDYSITFSPEMIVSNMPFYGTAYNGMTIGRDKGMRFKGKPEDFSVDRSKNGFDVSAKLKTREDTFSISMSVSDSGLATLSISSNNRETMSYQGGVK